MEPESIKSFQNRSNVHEKKYELSDNRDVGCWVAKTFILGVNMFCHFNKTYLLLFLLLFSASCGGSSSDSEGTATPEIVLNLPAEFSTGETGRAVPDYVTGIFLTVTGDGMEDIELSIDPDNLSASVTVTFGTRTFSIVITTSIGKTFTGWKTVEVTSGSTRIIEINLVVNDPPKVTLRASNGAPAIGQAVALSATATDADGDPMTYSWSKSGGALSASGLSGKWHSPDSGTYTITFTASDGRGGVGTATVGITVQAPAGPMPPVITSLLPDITLPGTGVNVTFTAIANDPNGDPLTYTWNGGGGILTGSGATVSWSSATQGSFTVSVTVDDGNGGTDTASYTIGVWNPLATINYWDFNAWSGAAGSNTINLSWTSVVDATQYEIVSNSFNMGEGCGWPPGPAALFGVSPVIPGSPFSVATLTNQFKCDSRNMRCNNFAFRASNPGYITSPPLIQPWFNPNDGITCPSPLYHGTAFETGDTNGTQGTAEPSGWIFAPSWSYNVTAWVNFAGDIDYVAFNTGTANSITFAVTWGGAIDLLDFYIEPAGGGPVFSIATATLGSEGPATWTVPAPYANTTMYLKVVGKGALTGWSSVEIDTN